MSAVAAAVPQPKNGSKLQITSAFKLRLFSEASRLRYTYDKS
jgi:hypothetical protein